MFKNLQHRIHGRICFRSVFKNIIQLFEQLLYPSKCLKCGAGITPDAGEHPAMENRFCDLCMAAGFYPITIPFCVKCGLPFSRGFDENHVCETCLKTPLKLDRVRAAVAYRGIMKDAIPLFKYHSKLSLAKVFEYLLFQAFCHHYSGSGIDLVIPIPLHRKKLRTRGFNQAYLMIRNFIKIYQNTYKQAPQWKIDIVSLARIKPTEPQTGFDMDHRKDNLKNAFRVVHKNAIENKNILLIDDVFTTGATCNEAACELLKNGAAKVEALVLARA